jgi:3-phosphoshikimate 1-carboxyvinyltransferase
MDVTVHPGRLTGRARIPASKSHTIRGLVIGALAPGVSTLRDPLESSDTRACISVLRGLGVDITEDRNAGGRLTALVVSGRGGEFSRPAGPLDCENSGTTFFVMLGAAALADVPVTLTGDEQLRRRSAAPLLGALEDLGAHVEPGGETGFAPVTVTGPLAGGTTSITCPTSQYLSSLLLATPLATGASEIVVPLLNERPYVQMTLGWLDACGISLEADGLQHFRIPGGQSYRPFDRSIPADFSSASFLLAAAAITGSELFLAGLDMTDSQGDKEVVHILERLGCSVQAEADGIRITGPAARSDGGRGALAGGMVDLNAIPDALPALAVVGTSCGEPLRLANVPQAREKETDRIAVMAGELRKLGAQVEELRDGLVVHPSRLCGGTVDSHGDHRVAMALAVAGLRADGPVTITGAEVARITYPGFYDTLRSCGAEINK